MATDDVDLLLEDNGKDRKDAAEAVDDHEGEGDTQSRTVLVDPVELRPDDKYK